MLWTLLPTAPDPDTSFCNAALDNSTTNTTSQQHPFTSPPHPRAVSLSRLPTHKLIVPA